MNNSAFSFQTLTPELIFNSLATIGINIDSGLTALNSYENRVYQFSDENQIGRASCRERVLVSGVGG